MLVVDMGIGILLLVCGSLGYSVQSGEAISEGDLNNELELCLVIVASIDGGLDRRAGSPHAECPRSM